MVLLREEGSQRTTQRRLSYPAAWRVPEAEKLPDGGTLLRCDRAFLRALRRDYQDYLRQRGLKEWSYNEPLRQELIDARCASAEDVALWVREVRTRLGHNGRRPTYAEIAANAALVLIAVACSLLDRQLASLAKRFLEDGGFTERMYRIRSQHRRQ